jgi:hypothetical protein
VELAEINGSSPPLAYPLVVSHKSTSILFFVPFSILKLSKTTKMTNLPNWHDKKYFYLKCHCHYSCEIRLFSPPFGFLANAPTQRPFPYCTTMAERINRISSLFATFLTKFPIKLVGQCPCASISWAKAKMFPHSRIINRRDNRVRGEGKRLVDVV